MATTEVRKAVEADLKELGRMGAQLVRFHYDINPRRFMVPEGDLEAGYSWWLGRELQKKEALVLVAQNETGIVGYAYGRIEARDWNTLRDRCGVLIDIFVDEKARQAGVGKALCEDILRRFKEMEVPRVVLMTAASNIQAHKLFFSFGWQTSMFEMTKEL